MSHAILDSRISWTRLAATLAIASVGNVGMWAVVAIMPAVEAEFAVDRALVSMPYTATMLGFALGSLVAGRIVDRYGISLTLLGAAALNAIGFAGAAVAPTILTLVAFQALLGLGSAACFGPLMADISHWFLRRRGIAVAIAAMGNYLSGAIWPVAFSSLLATQGWRAFYVALAALSLAAMVPLALYLRRKLPADAHAQADRIASANRSAAGMSPRVLLGLLTIAGFSCCMAMAMPQVHIVALSVDLGCGAHAGVQMLSLMLLGGVASRFVSGLLADRIGGLRTLLIGSTLQCIALGLYLPATTQTQLYVVSLVFGLAQGGIVPSYAIIVREYLPAARAGTYTGIAIMATIVGMAVGGWASGLIHDLTGAYRLAFLNGIGWNLLNIAIVSLILFSTRSARPSLA